MSRYRLEIKNFKIIEYADVKIDGITVLTGLNSSGKTTISKFLYHFININISLDKLINARFVDSMIRLEAPLFRSLRVVNKIENNFAIFQNFSNSNKDNSDIDSLVEMFSRTIQIILDEDLRDSSNIDKLELSGVMRILEQHLGMERAKDLNSHKDILYALLLFIEKLNTERLVSIDTRQEEVLLAELNDRMNSHDENFTYQLYLDNIPVAHDNCIDRILDRNVIYIDDNSTIFDKPLWSEVNYYFNSETSRYRNSSIDTIFKSEDILGGDIELSDQTGEQFYYKGDQKFSLSECASGVVVIAKLYLLYKNGYINEDSIIIIDEPEAHLHPQWIVEYARLIITLHKELKATFLIASHSPILLRAMRSITIKEELEKYVNFYLSSPSQKNINKFVFEHKEIDIEDIFETFNISIDKTNAYGGT